MSYLSRRERDERQAAAHAEEWQVYLIATAIRNIKRRCPLPEWQYGISGRREMAHPLRGVAPLDAVSYRGRAG